MRQRGPTATALSPGLYLDGHSARIINVGVTTASTTTTSTSDTPVSLTPPPDLYASTIPSKLTTISPVLSRIQSPAPNTSNMTPDLKQKDLSSRTGSVPLHSKLHKKHKNRRINFNQINGDIGRNLHSLKVTIRRTSQSHKIDSNGFCAAGAAAAAAAAEADRDQSPVVTDLQSPLGSTLPCVQRPNNVLDRVLPARPFILPRPCSSPCTSTVPLTTNAADRQNPVSKVDASTSTLDRSTLTDPDVLGPCEAGTKVVVEGVVWLETSGMLVLNVQWRGRSYVGTLLDASRQSIGPTCMDKGITSALSLLDGRRAWSYSPSGRFRSRGMHHFHHHHRSFHHRHHNSGGTMTTRSAAAAAAASQNHQDSSNELIDSSSAELLNNHTNTNPVFVTAPEFTTTTTTTSAEDYDNSTRPQRGGGKRRRRRGAAGSRPYRRLNNNMKNSANSNNHSSSSSNGKIVSTMDLYPTTPNSSHLDVLDEKDEEQSSISVPASVDGSDAPAASFACPYPDCKKIFDDLVSMRYHFSMGHTVQSLNCGKTQTIRCNIDENPVDEPANNTLTDSEFICVDDQGPTSSPPPLGRAHKQINGSHENSLEPMTAEDGFDNLEPPRLHRIVSITESTNGLSQATLASSSPSKQGDNNDEPPAPSPAYSDISDDGTVPANQSASFLDAFHPPPGSKVGPSVGSALLSPPSSSFSSHSPRVGFDPTLALSMASPTAQLSCSPSIRQHTPNGYYFPVGLLPSSGTTTLETGLLAAVPAILTATSPVMPNHTHPVATAASVGSNLNKSQSRRLSQLTVPSHSTCTVACSQSSCSSTTFQLLPPPVGASSANTIHIPGVNSFASLPPEVSLHDSAGGLTVSHHHHLANTDSNKTSTFSPGTAVFQSVEPSLRWRPGSSPLIDTNGGTSFPPISSSQLKEPSSQDPRGAVTSTDQARIPLHSGSLRLPFTDGTFTSNHLASLSTRFPFVYRSK